MAGAEARRELTALVTGAGAPPGVSIFKALRQSALRPRVVATDADPISVGLFRADAGYVLPRVTADEPAYLSRLEEVCRRERVDLVCFGSEVEMRRVAPFRAELERRTGARLVVNEAALLERFMDKWGMFEALHDRGLPVPETVLAGDRAAAAALVARRGFPLILKPRHGSGSRDLHLVKSAGELAWLTEHVPEPVLQEHLLPDDEEYTVGVYRSPRSGYLGQITFRRSLAAGLTYKAEVVFDEEIAAACRRVVEAFDLWGPVNLQLRKTREGVRVFEINLRFSSSAVMRAHFGFNEAELCLRDLVLGEPLAMPAVRRGWALRYWDEVYLDEEACAAVRRDGRVEGPAGRKEADF
ncbi:ATP-grasp domain-containing protein [Anaeromyxobacter diazotrophicus]|uniref:Carbamoyl phosphate synthase n=1 Tax=Anaeromyxobacter diazotrophicus TaxID=2590199 RepID=A0A7I9VIM5_9BACT|nr:ATP-grasp domain-containing protein [Anaeromyxobacter diazotrophicus]GEJ56254.1 carbamoyl phosphate synthase [Anaeromyxobacter diazotrophicus]